ncbi:CoA pyrophosphatase [bacterium]|nr:MAG: CoA pyrophosphatase [bacterium]
MLYKNMEPLKAIDQIRSRLSSRRRLVMPAEELSPAAVALLLSPGRRGLDLLFTLRTGTVLHHKGEVSFPGGRADPCDSSFLDTALRETWEEIGVRPKDLEILGVLDDRTSVSGYLVTPVVMFLPEKDYSFKPEPAEVCEVFTVPLPHLSGPDSHLKRINSRHPDDLYSFTWEHRVIWGLTASILHGFLTVAFDYEFRG